MSRLVGSRRARQTGWPRSPVAQRLAFTNGLFGTLVEESLLHVLDY